MVDIHMHILPCVDDGARDMDMALAMLREAEREGIGTIVATGHSYAYALDPQKPRRQYQALCRAAEEAGISVRLLPGMEMYCHPDIVETCLAHLQSGVFCTLNGSSLVLTEFDTHGVTESDAVVCMEQLLSAGYVPVIAHVERYAFANPASVEHWRRMGALIQINAYSIAEDSSEQRKNLTRALLEAQLVDFLGSDAHRMRYRSPRVQTGVAFLYEHYEPSYADAIVWKNAERQIVHHG